MITIRSINGEILTHFDNSVPDGNPYFEPVMTDDMESLVSSFSFSVPLEVEDSVYLQGLNQVLTKDRYGDLRLFIITDVYEEWTTVGGSVKVDCEDISISEMNDIVVSPFNGISFEDTLNKTFNNSGWTLQYGANWKDVDNTTFVLEEYDNMRSVIASIIDTYGCQFKFLAQENQYGEITRVVEVFKTRGVDTGKYFYYDRDLLGIERDIQHSNIKTAIHPYYTGYNGKTYTLYDFYPVNPDPDFQKDKKSTLIINKEASKLYDDGNSYRIMPYKAEVEGDPELVYREAIKELKKYAEPIYTYKVNVILLQNLYGWDGEDIELGDTVWMKERVGRRELGLEARVTAYEYHEDDPSADVVTFSNFKEIDTTDAKEIAERIFIAYANSADGKVDFSIDDSTNRAYMGVYTSATKTQSTDPDTYTWSRTKGEDGNSAPTLDLTSSQQVMKLKSDGTPDGEQTIIFTATKQNSTAAVVWEAIPYKGNLVQPAITLDGTGDVKTLTSAQWDKDWTRLQVTVTMGNLKDIQTIVMVSDGATGASGTAIVGFLTNESTTFAANPEGVVDDYSNGSGRFVIYEGTKEVTSGVVYTKVSNVGINFLINATTGEYIVSNMTQDHAQAVVKAVYKEVTITKFLSFSKSRQGAKGDKGDTGSDGIAGKDGIGLKSTVVTYAASTSGTTSPSTGWQVQVPTVAPNNYLWTRTIWTYTDGTSETGYSVAKMGKDGAKGDDGIAGKDGVGIAKTLIEYAVSASGTTKPTSGWSTAIPTTPQGQYLWTRTTWTYTDSTTEQGFTVARQGEKGDKGDQGIAGQKGADGRTQYTHIAYADNASGGGFSQDPTGKAYIGMYVDFEELDSSDPIKYAWSLIKGADGEKGVAGAKGEDGRTPYFHTAYTNSTDFGTHDYSGNPNLMPYITDPWVGSLLANGDTVKDSVKRVITHTKTRTADAGDVLSLGLGIPRTAEANNQYLITALRPSTPYTLTVTMSVGSDWTGKTDTIGARVRYLNAAGGTEIPINGLLPANVERDKMITHTFTGTTKANLTGMKNCYVQIFSVNSEDKGTVSVSYDVKLEIGTIATPYQPNLLDAPYYLSKVALGENIANPTKTFPINTSAYLVYTGANTEPYIAGQKYTVTMKATKPATQTFNVFMDSGTIGVGSMTSVEGLTNVWQKTFTVSQANINAGVTNRLAIYQVPNSSVGDVQIDWLKIEKGDTRTPNIDSYKYLGNYTDFEQADSLNPTKYSWSLIKGTDGADGKPAQLLTLQSDTPVMRFDSADVVVSGQVVTFNSFKQGIESGTTWTATPYKGNVAQPNITLGGTGDTRTLTASQWASGVTTIKVVVNAGGFTDTVTITKVKDGAKGDKGDSGADGIAGKDGVGLKSTTVTYAPSASGTVAPASGWQTQVPTVAPNNFLWTKTEWTYTDLSTEVGYSVAKMGADGAKGDDGIAGKDGVGIEDTLIEYAMSASGTVKPTSGWTTSIPVVLAGQFLWTRTTWTYTDSTTEQGFTVAKQGEKGDKGDTGASGKDGIAGKDGVGLASTNITYASSTSGTTAPSTGWQEQVPVVAPNNFLWTKTVWNYTDGDSETGYSVAKMGANGANGSDGIAGKDGVGIKATVIDYVVSTQGTTPPSSGWTTTIPITPEGQYLWTRTKWTYTDNTNETGYSVAKQGAKGDTGASGKDGVAGKDGVGIKTTAISYAGSSNGTTAPVTGWQEQVPTVAPNNFLWTRTVWTYTDNSTETGYSVAKMGADGAKGDDGIAGKDGVGIVSTVIEYATSTSGTTKPLTGWTTTVPTVPQGNFLWTRTTWNYSDDTSEQGFTVARQGSNGSNGADAYSPILTNESTTFAASPTGVVTDWSVGNGVFMVYRGTTRVTTGVTYAVESVSNSEGTINASTGAYSITNLTKDNGTITFKATVGSVVLTKTMSLSKSRQGLEGAQGAQGIQGVRGVAIYNPTEPSGNIEEGATWFQTESATNDLVIAMYTRKSGVWVKTPVAAGALQVEQLSAISADIGNVTAGNILGIKITGSEFLQTWNIDQGTEVQKGETRLYNGAIRQIDSVTNKTTGNERVYSTATISNGEINGTRNVKWDDGSIRQLANLTISGAEIRMYNSEEGVGYQGTITAKALTNLGWKTLQMGSLFEAKESNPPQYKVIWQLDGTRIIKFRGQFGLKSGNMAAGNSYYPFRSENTPSSGTSYVPTEIIPNRTAFGYGATSAYHGGRLAMTTAPNLLFNSAEAVSYCSLESFQYIIE